MTRNSPANAASWKLSKPIKVLLALTNRATKEKLHDGLKLDAKGKSSKKSPKWSVTLVETLENSIVLDVPRDFCSQGQQVQVLMTTQGLEDEVSFKIVAKVIKQSFESKKVDRESVHLEFIDYNAQTWAHLCSIFQNRQTDVTRVFYALKG